MIFNLPCGIASDYKNEVLAISQASPLSTIIINNDTIRYRDFIVNATDNVIIANCTFTMVDSNIYVYGNLTVQNATIWYEWVYATFGAWIYFYNQANLTAQKANFTGDVGWELRFNDASKAYINYSTLDEEIRFYGNSIGNISNTKIVLFLDAYQFSRVDLYNVSLPLREPGKASGVVSVGWGGAPELNAHNLTTEYFFADYSSKVSLLDSWVNWMNVEDSPNITLYNSGVADTLEVHSESSVINVYGSTIGWLRIESPYDFTKVRDHIFIYNSNVSKMRQYYRFYGEVTLNQTGAYGEYFQAIRLTNTTVGTLLNPVVVCQNNTKTTIKDIDLRWLYLYDQSQVQLWNSTTEATYIYGYEGFLTGYYNNTSLWGQVNGKISIDATQQAKTTLEIWAIGWVSFAISKTTSPGTSPLGRKASTGTYVNMTAVGTVHAAQIRIHYTDEDIASKHLDETTLKIYYWNGSAWMPCQTTSVNTIENYAWANVTNLTIYTIIGEISAIHFYKLIWSRIYSLFIQNETDSTYARSNLPLPI